MFLWLCANGEFVRGVHLILAACLLGALFCLHSTHHSRHHSQLCIPALGNSCSISPPSCLLHTFLGSHLPPSPPAACPGTQLLFQSGRNLQIDFCAALINIYEHSRCCFQCLTSKDTHLQPAPTLIHLSGNLSSCWLNVEENHGNSGSAELNKSPPRPSSFLFF